MERPSTFVAAGAAAGVFVTGGFAREASADVDAGIGAHQLLGTRYETMLALARRLDATAQSALEGADDGVRPGSLAPARLRSQIRSFAGSIRQLHRTMAERQATAVELPSALADLARRAHGLRGRMGRIPELASTSEAWDAVADVLERMALLLAGHPVQVPSDYVHGALAGASVLELRHLASEVEASAARSHGLATRASGGYRQRGQQFLGELRHFASQARDLRVQATTRALDPRTIGPLVDHLLEEAVLADRRMREAGVFTEVREDSGRTITLLERMARLVRP